MFRERIQANNYSLLVKYLFSKGLPNNYFKNYNNKIQSESQTESNELISIFDSIVSLPSNSPDTTKTNEPADLLDSNADKKLPSSTKTEDIKIPFETETMAILNSMLEREHFETGISNPSENYFQELLSKDKIATMNGVSNLFMDNYSVESRKVNILVGILHIISHNSYEEMYPLGTMIAMASLNHKNSEVAEFGIKCFENWNHVDGIEKLKAINFSSKWLNDYAKEVVKDIEERK